MSKAKDAAPEQLERFKQAARALGCDEGEAAFDEKLKAIARHRTPDVINAELAGASAELKRLHDAFDRYSGNNPRKYAAQIRLAAAKVARLEAELKRLG